MAGTPDQTTDGIMIFGNSEGLTIFDPLSLKINATKPKPVITSLKINNIATSSIDNKEFVLSESINTLKELTPRSHAPNLIARIFRHGFYGT
jgi:hypothetical protein